MSCACSKPCIVSYCTEAAAAKRQSRRIGMTFLRMIDSHHMGSSSPEKLLQRRRPAVHQSRQRSLEGHPPPRLSPRDPQRHPLAQQLEELHLKHHQPSHDGCMNTMIDAPGLQIVAPKVGGPHTPSVLCTTTENGPYTKSDRHQQDARLVHKMIWLTNMRPQQAKSAYCCALEDACRECSQWHVLHPEAVCPPGYCQDLSQIGLHRMMDGM